MTDLTNAAPVLGRDLRIDFFRGICLVMIFINHVPGTVYEWFTSRNFGHSDAAEGFVLMAGIAAALAYARPIREGLRWAVICRIWKRAWTLYLVHIMLSVAALGMISFGVKFMDSTEILTRNGFARFINTPLDVHLGLPLLGYQLGYVNILPMYMVLMLAAPFIIWCALRWPLRTWVGAFLFWGLTSRFGLNMPNFPQQGGWFFNPFAWSVLFTTGALIGVSLKSGKRLVPVWRWLQVLAVIVLAVSCLAVQWPRFGNALGHGFWLLQEAGMPRLFTTFDKTFVSFPRLVHILSLAYVLSSLTIFLQLARSRVAAPVRLIGRHSLPIFSLGTLLAFAAQVVKGAYPPSFALDSLLILGGVVLLAGFAWLLEDRKLKTH